MFGIELGVIAEFLTAVVVMVAGYYINKLIQRWHQRYLDWDAKRESEKAKDKAQTDRERISDSLDNANNARDKIPIDEDG